MSNDRYHERQPLNGRSKRFSPGDMESMTGPNATSISINDGHNGLGNDRQSDVHVPTVSLPSEYSFHPTYAYGSYDTDDVCDIRNQNDYYSYDASREVLLIDALNRDSAEGEGGFEDLTGDTYSTYPATSMMMSQKSSTCQDPVFAVLFLLHLSIFLTLSVFSSISLASPILSFLRLQSQAGESDLTTSQSSGNAVKELLVVILHAISSFVHSTFPSLVSTMLVAGALSVLVVTIWYFLMKGHAMLTITASIVLSIGSILWLSLSSYSGAGFFSATRVFSLLLCIALAVFYYSIRKRLMFAQALLSASASAISSRKQVISISFASAFSQSLWFLCWFIGTFTILLKAGLMSISSIPIQDTLLATVNGDDSSLFSLGGAVGLSLYMGLFLALYWPLSVMEYIAHTTIAGTVADWWLRFDADVAVSQSIQRAQSSSGDGFNSTPLVPENNSNAVLTSQVYITHNTSSNSNPHRLSYPEFNNYIQTSTQAFPPGQSTSSRSVSPNHTHTKPLAPKRGGQTAVVLRRVLGYSFGTICFAALIMTSIQLITSLLRLCAPKRKKRSFLQSLSSGSSGSSDIITSGSVAIFCASFLLNLLENITMYFNEYALVYVAIYGDTFVKASKSAYATLRHHGMTAVINDDVSSYPIILGRFLCVFVGGVSSYWLAKVCDFPLPLLLVVVIGAGIGAIIGRACLSPMVTAVKATFIIWAALPNRMMEVRREEYHDIIAQYDCIYG